MKRSRGSIVKRGPNTWAVVIELDKSTTGKRHPKWHTVKGTRSDAEKEKTRLLHERDHNTYTEPSKLTVAGYLDDWLDTHARHRVGAKTHHRYSEIVRLNLAPHLGHHRLEKLHPKQIAELHNLLLTSGRQDQRKGTAGLSARTVLHAHRLLNNALNQAVRLGLISRNPAAGVDPPRPAASEARAIDGPAMAKLLAAAEGSRLYTPILLAILTGLRRGELLALRWQDIDLDRGTLNVHQSLQEVRRRGSGAAYFAPPKTTKSRRQLVLPATLVEALRRHRALQNEERLRLGPVWRGNTVGSEPARDEPLVFPALDGAPWSPNRFTGVYVTLVRRHGMFGLRFHDLRHSHATALMVAGVHPKIVSERLGHSTVGITLDLYSHSMAGLDADAAQRAGDALTSALAKAGKPRL